MLERWKDHCQILYAKNTSVLDEPSTLDINVEQEEHSPLLAEVREAIKDLNVGKSPGDDEATADLIKKGEAGVIYYHKLCTRL